MDWKDLGNISDTRSYQSSKNFCEVFDQQAQQTITNLSLNNLLHHAVKIEDELENKLCFGLNKLANDFLTNSISNEETQSTLQFTNFQCSTYRKDGSLRSFESVSLPGIIKIIFQTEINKLNCW